MNLIQWLFFIGTAGLSLGFTLYGQWVLGKYGKPGQSSAITGCEIARFVLDQAGLSQVGVTPLESSGEYSSAEGLFLEPRIYEGRDLLSVLYSARQAFLKSQLSNMTFWAHLKRRMALVVRCTAWSGWILFLTGNFIPGTRFLVNVGLGCFVTVMILAIFDLPFELDVEEKTASLLKRSGFFQLNELMDLKKLNLAVAFWGLSLLIRAPLNLCRPWVGKNGNAYGI